MTSATSTLICATILERLAAGPLPDWQRFEPQVRVLSLKAGGRLFHVDEEQPYVYCVRSGIIKMVYETADGKEWIKAFAEEGRFFASLTALAPHGRTSFAALATCNATVEVLPYKLLLALADVHPVWQRALRRAFEIYGYRKETRERELLTLSAEERYARFLEDSAGLEARLADKDVASYIRVTPVALSRIKKRILQQQEAS